MSHKYSTVHHLFGCERPVKKRVSRMTLEEFRWWKYMHLRTEYGLMFDNTRVNEPGYMAMLGKRPERPVRGSYRNGGRRRRWWHKERGL